MRSPYDASLHGFWGLLLTAGSEPLSRATWTTWMWYHWGALMINQFKGRDVRIFGGGEEGSGTEVLAYYSLNKQNECALLLTLLALIFVPMTVRHANVQSLLRAAVLMLWPCTISWLHSARTCAQASLSFDDMDKLSS